MQIHEVVSVPRRFAATNLDATSFATLSPTVTTPSGNDVMDLVPNTVGGQFSRRMKCWPIGLGADDDAYSLRVWGWTHLGAGATAGKENLWFPSLIAEVAVVLCTKVGVANSPVLNTERFVDTITVVTQPKLIDTDSGGAASRGVLEIMSPGSNLIGFFTFPVLGFEKLQIQIDQTTNTPTGNVLVAPY